MSPRVLVVLLPVLLIAAVPVLAEVHPASEETWAKVTQELGEAAADFGQDGEWIHWRAAKFGGQDLDAFVMTDAKAWKLDKEDGHGVLSLFGKSGYAPDVRSPRNIARIKDLTVSDFVLDVQARQTGREYGHRDLCFFFGYQDPSHFYYAHVATAADPHAHSIFLVNGEPRVSIAEKRTEGADWGSDYQHIRIVRNTKSGDIRVYFDDMETPVMEANDKTFTWGQIGVGSFDDTGNFKRITVWGAPVEKK